MFYCFIFSTLFVSMCGTRDSYMIHLGLVRCILICAFQFIIIIMHSFYIVSRLSNVCRKSFDFAIVVVGRVGKIISFLVVDIVRLTC